MNSEQQYIDLFGQCRGMICGHSSDVLNAVREQAFDDFRRQGFPSRKVATYGRNKNTIRVGWWW